MIHCVLLKEFHEKYSDFIAIAESFRAPLIKRNFDTQHKLCNMGGSHGQYSARFKVHEDCVAIQVNGNNFSLTYYSMFYKDIVNQNVFHSKDNTAEIEFGNPQIKDQFKVCGDGFERNMSYPILEEQYFQYLTSAPLSSEEVYNYFNSIDIDHNCTIQLIAQNNGIQDFKNVMQDVTAMKELKRHLDLVSHAYKMTNGL